LSQQNKFKQGRLVKLLVQPCSVGIIDVVYDGKFVQEVSIYTTKHGVVITGVDCIRDMEFDRQRYEGLIWNWEARQGKLLVGEESTDYDQIEAY